MAGGFALAVLAQGLPGQTCSPDWTPFLFHEAGIEGQVFASEMFDADGPGPGASFLIAAGAFPEAGGHPASNIARWDGKQWWPLGAGLDGPVYALTLFDEDGPGPNPPRLFAGGGFSMAGGSPASCIARWDGTSWSSVGGGVAASFPSQRVTDLLVHDKDGPGPFLPALFVAGRFDAAGGAPANGLARWSGSAWSVVGQPGTGGMPPGAVVQKLAAFDDDGNPATPAKLAATGYVWTMSSQSRVGLWDGTTWTLLGGLFPTSSNIDSSITALKALDIDGPGPLPEMLFIGGSFSVVDGVTLNGVGVWMNGAWSALGAGLSGQAYSFSVHDDDGGGPAPLVLFVGGSFGQAGGVSSPGLAKWDGVSWAGTGGGVSGAVFALIEVDPDGPLPGPQRLLVAGSFSSAGGFSVLNVARWDGAWHKLGSSIDGTVETLIEYDADGPGAALPLLCAGGGFSIPTTTGIANNVAFWDGLSWSPAGPGPGGTVYAALMFDLDGNPATPPSLVVGGDFGVAAWDGIAWTQLLPLPVPPTLYLQIRALAAFDDDGPGPQPAALFAGGKTLMFSGPSTVWCAEVLRLTATGWVTLPAPFNWCHPYIVPPLNVDALAVFDEDGPGPALPQLFAGGTLSPPPLPSTLGVNVAKWDGLSWQPVGGGLGTTTPYETVRDLVVFDPDGAGPAGPELFACGRFSAPFNNIARWNGTSWLDVSGGLALPATNTAPSVERLLPIDLDGTGPNPPVLVAGGVFIASGATPLQSIAYWDGMSWFPFGAGISGGGSTFGPSLPFGSGRVAALLQIDLDGPGPLPAALFAGGDFGQAGTASSGDLARWGAPPAIAFTLAIGPSGSLAVTHASCIPGGNYASFFSFDPLNATAPGLGGVAGLHISAFEVMLQFQSGAPPFVGVLGPGGGAQFSVPASAIAPFAGMTVYGVSLLYSAPLLLPYPESASPVASLLL